MGRGMFISYEERERRFWEHENKVKSSIEKLDGNFKSTLLENQFVADNKVSAIADEYLTRPDERKKKMEAVTLVYELAKERKEKDEATFESINQDFESMGDFIKFVSDSKGAEDAKIAYEEAKKGIDQLNEIRNQIDLIKDEAKKSYNNIELVLHSNKWQFDIVGEESSKLFKENNLLKDKIKEIGSRTEKFSELIEIFENEVANGKASSETLEQFESIFNGEKYQGYLADRDNIIEEINVIKENIEVADNKIAEAKLDPNVKYDMLKESSQTQKAEEHYLSNKIDLEKTVEAYQEGLDKYNEALEVLQTQVQPEINKALERNAEREAEKSFNR